MISGTDIIICGNNTEVLGEIPDGFVNLTCCSPPYDAMRVSAEYTHRFNFARLTDQLYRVTRVGGMVVWVVADETIDGGKSGTSFRQALGFMEVGFKLYDTIIYAKTGTSFPSSGRYTNCYEFMFCFSKGKPETVNLIRDVDKKWAGSWGKTRQRKKDGTLQDSTAANCGAGKSGRAVDGEYGQKARTNIWQITNGKGFAHTDPGGELAYKHPATFPLALARDHILSWTNEGDVVLDPFNGAGTTCVAAKMTGRRYIGIDVSEEYCEIARRRIEQIKDIGAVDD